MLVTVTLTRKEVSNYKVGNYLSHTYKPGYLQQEVEGEPGEEQVRDLLAEGQQGEHDPVGHPSYILLNSRSSISHTLDQHVNHLTYP